MAEIVQAVEPLHFIACEAHSHRVVSRSERPGEVLAEDGPDWDGDNRGECDGDDQLDKREAIAHSRSHGTANSAPDTLDADLLLAPTVQSRGRDQT